MASGASHVLTDMTDPRESGTAHDFRARLEGSTIDPTVVYYWGYMYDLSYDYMLDYLERRGVRIRGSKVVEIGAAEGGNLCAMAQRGAGELVGTDIARARLESAEAIADIFITIPPRDAVD